MPRPRTEKAGKIFGRLTIICQEHIDPDSSKNDTYRCRCTCGNEVVVRYTNLTKGSRKSCGCWNIENLAALKAVGAANRAALQKYKEEKAVAPRPPKKTNHPLWDVYRGMIKRCYYHLNDNYKFYGAKGIAVCDEWKNDFWKFVADVGERPPGTTLDRKDNSGNYEPGNCRWADKQTQYSNTTSTACYVATLRGGTKLVSDWAREKEFSYRTAIQDIRKGVPAEVAVISAMLRKQVHSKHGGQPPEVWEECRRKAEAWVALNP